MPKTKRSYRTILINGVLISQLESYHKWCIQKKLSIGKLHRVKVYVFISDQDDTPIANNTLNYCFRRINKQINLKKITPHGLRHTHATILISQRISLQTSIFSIIILSNLSLKYLFHFLRSHSTIINITRLRPIN
ncbi:hypothetical protein CSV77_04955 [Sporosarcina sp. P16b]|uniref:tyrosine-type recombinase/integrase n=1 Tax=Sporosarcina sp. P16b TaxID=2048261 RepID=UPI000C16E883|nr:hypothetical protein CSV77_04955 [Sporosarcina sp. P16b]